MFLLPKAQLTQKKKSKGLMCSNYSYYAFCHSIEIFLEQWVSNKNIKIVRKVVWDNGEYRAERSYTHI